MMEYEAARTSCVLFDLSTRGKIEASGTEAIVFLHNLSTNDIKTVPIGKGCEVFFCTVTAKVLAHGWIWRDTPEGKRERLWLDLDPGLAEKLYHHLDRHLISEDVTLTDHTHELIQLHLAGPRATEVLTASGVGEGVTIRAVERLEVSGVDILCRTNDADRIRERLIQAGARPGDDKTFDVLRVEAGMPVFGVDMEETTFAPEVNRAQQAISYNKGCYLGQEPIVMARDRGIVQRALVGLHLDTLVSTSSVLYRDGKEVGRVTSCVQSPRLGPIALAHVRRASQTPGTVVEVDDKGTKHGARVAALPFA
jgi:folate-binding protein YgfZ